LLKTFDFPPVYGFVRFALFLAALETTQNRKVSLFVEKMWNICAF
jgi:hypothetical protein